MSKEDIIKMAREAGFCHDINNGIYLCAPVHIERLAALVAAAEREACAHACESRYMGDNNREDMEARRCAEAIRARKETT